MSSLRAKLYRLHWDLRSRVSPFGLTEGIALLRESERWPRERIAEMRDAKLRRVVAHAYDQSPHYRKMMEEAGVRPADVRGLADLPKLPVLTKETLRAHANELRARDFASDEKIEVGVTGGTTGTPMKVYRDLDCTVWQRASYWRGYSWGGFQMGEPYAQVFGGSLGLAKKTPRETLKNWFSGRLFLPAFELGEHNVDQYVDAIRKSGARFLIGYASACHLFATRVERTGAKLSFDAVYPTAETLPESWRETMERVFGAKVLPYYGCGEVQSLGYSCDVTRGLYHTCDEHSVIEVEGKDGRARLEGDGTFLITDLDNLAMPLIRYRNGDAGEIAGPGCACGRSLGRILRLDGRVSEVLLTAAGDAISGLIIVHAFKFVKNVDQFQLVQRRPGHATVRLVRGPGYVAEEEEPKLHAIFVKHLGSEQPVDFEYVPSIPRTTAGKTRLIVNECLPKGGAPAAAAPLPSAAATA